MRDPTTCSERRALGARLDDALVRTRTALTDEGSGVLSEIDVQAPRTVRLGVERESYTILGACNPQLANQSLMAEPQRGALLPCNAEGPS